MASATCLDKSSRLASLLPGGRCGFSDVLGKSSRLASLLRGGAAASATYWEKARDLRRSYGAPTWLQRRTWKMARGWRRRPKRLHSHVGAARAASLSSCSAVITPSCCRRKRWRCDDGPCARGGAVIWRRWRTWGKARGSRRSYRGPAGLQRRTWIKARDLRRSYRVPARLQSYVGAARAASLSLVPRAPHHDSPRLTLHPTTQT